MKNNIFCLVVDALAFPYLNDKYNAMPFLKKLRECGHDCTNMYAQGPYTEAALTPFYTGRDNMDFGGNFFRGQQTVKTVFEAFNENGFDVINYTQPLIYPKPMHRGINCERYGVCYFFSAVWDYRLYYYVDLYKQNKLTDDDWNNIYELLDSNLNFWIKYIEDAKTEKEESDFINLYTDKCFNFDEVLLKVKEEYDSFKKNKLSYVETLLQLGKKHRVFSIENYFMTAKNDNDDLYNKIKKGYVALFKKIEKFNSLHNKSPEYSMGAILKVCKNLIIGHKSIAVCEAKKYYYHRKIRSTRKEIKHIFNSKSNYKPEPTILQYFNHFCGWYKRRSTEKPFYCMMHVSDLHTPEIFFSIDSDNWNEVNAELKIINEYLDSLPSDFSGNVIYWLSMRYVDWCIEKMFHWFKEEGLIDSTVFVITADHGSSFGFRPVRTTLVNNEHDENYHIPCVIVGKEIMAQEDDRYFTTKDICKTILNVNNIDDSVFTGRNMLSKEGECGYAITEYLGGGCPDISRRVIIFIIRDDVYSIEIKQPVTEEFSVKNIISVYDRKVDYMEKENIINAIDFNKIEYLINKVKNRFFQIQQEYISKQKNNSFNNGGLL